jgi:hypothetical protein
LRQRRTSDQSPAAAGDDVAQGDGVVERAVAGSEQERDGAAPAFRSEKSKGIPLLLQLAGVTAAELAPFRRIVAEPAAQA